MGSFRSNNTFRSSSVTLVVSVVKSYDLELFYTLSSTSLQIRDQFSAISSKTANCYMAWKHKSSLFFEMAETMVFITSYARNLSILETTSDNPRDGSLTSSEKSLVYK